MNKKFLQIVHCRLFISHKNQVTHSQEIICNCHKMRSQVLRFLLISCYINFIMCDVIIQESGVRPIEENDMALIFCKFDKKVYSFYS